MATITTHVLDTARGRPAAGITVELARRDGEAFTVLGHGVTDLDGRLKTLTPSPVAAGLYRLTFATQPYFAAAGTSAFFPLVTITFEVGSDAHYHVPLLLSPFGYSTYRGS